MLVYQTWGLLCSTAKLAARVRVGSNPRNSGEHLLSVWLQKQTLAQRLNEFHAYPVSGHDPEKACPDLIRCETRFKERSMLKQKALSADLCRRRGRLDARPDFLAAASAPAV